MDGYRFFLAGTYCKEKKRKKREQRRKETNTEKQTMQLTSQIQITAEKHGQKRTLG